MNLSEQIIAHITQLASKIEYGRIIIEINAGHNRIDVVSEHRKRFCEPAGKRILQ